MRDWNLGDGQTLSPTSSAPISHTYLTTSTFSVVLTATNRGGSDTASTLITVTEQTIPSWSLTLRTSTWASIRPSGWTRLLTWRRVTTSRPCGRGQLHPDGHHRRHLHL
jgi:PKD repeat protein